MTHPIISSPNGQLYFDTLYLVAILFAGALFIMDGRRKQMPQLQWLLIYASATFFFICGTKLFTYSLNDWKYIFSHFELPYTSNKTVLGGIIGAVLGIHLAKRLMRFRAPVLDSFAVSFPVAMAIQRIGCLLAGCCFGTPSNVPWAISYGELYAPYQVHLHMGLIGPGEVSSLAIHPNPLYQIILCCAIALLVWRLRNAFRAKGNLFFLSIGLYWLARFAVEFLRDPASNGHGGELYHGLKHVQWALMAAIILTGMLIFFRELLTKRKVFSITSTGPLLPSAGYLFFAFIVLLACLGRTWFTGNELLFICIVLLPSSVVVCNSLRCHPLLNGRQRLSYLLSIAALVLIHGGVTAQKIYRGLTSEKSSHNVFEDIRFGYGAYHYSHYHAPPVQMVDGCGNVYYKYQGSKYTHTSNFLGASYSYTKTNGKFKRMNFDISGSFGYNKESVAASPAFNKEPILLMDINPSVRADSRWVGVGVGFHAGNYLEDKMKANGIYATGNKPSVNILPSVAIRVLPYDIAFIDCRFNEAFPYVSGNIGSNDLRVGIGTGLGLRDGSGIVLGSSRMSGLYLAANFRFRNKYGFEATWFTEDEIHLQVAFNWRFRQKSWNKE